MHTFLPRFSYGTNAYDDIRSVCSPYGSTCALIYGKKAFEASKDQLLPAVECAGLKITAQVCYGHEATFENVEILKNNASVMAADMLFAIGGGKCIDTVKLLGTQSGKPVFTIPTIASTCAAVTKLSIMYHDDGSFAKIVNYECGPVHSFIHTGIIAQSPDVYLWAGIGDTMAKYIECTFSARGDELTFEQAFGVNTSRMCFYPILEGGEAALEAKKSHEVSRCLEDVILNIIVSTGTVSICVGEDYNSALAHALNYGFSCRSHIEKNHYHGEVVSYGALLQLWLDKQTEDFVKAYRFWKKIGLPVSLTDLEFDLDDPLEDVLDITVINKELEHTPYKVTKDMIRTAMKEMEAYHQEQKGR